jgi:hypothetical protein
MPPVSLKLISGIAAGEIPRPPGRRPLISALLLAIFGNSRSFPRAAGPINYRLRPDAMVPSNATTESRFAIRRNPKLKLQASGPSNPETLQTQSRAPQRNRRSFSPAN